MTPWLRRLALAEALCRVESATWLVPGGHFVALGDTMVAGAHFAGFAKYPWLMAPLESRWLRVHADPMRTVGCCGLSFRGEDFANLVCGCGAEVGLGYRDCCNPHWYALHGSVGVETEAEERGVEIGVLERRVEAVRRIVEGVAPAGVFIKGSGARHGEPETWRGVRRLTDVRLGCAGGVESPTLLVSSAQLPGQGTLVLPIPWGQLVRMLVLAEMPWGSPEVPLQWQGGVEKAPTVTVSRLEDRVLLTAWAREQESAVVIAADVWAAAWTRLRDVGE